MTQSEICNLAHEKADDFAKSEGIPSGTMLPFVAWAGAELAGLGGKDAELYIERFTGHMINLQCGTRGV